MSESSPPTTERSAVDGRDGTTVSQARDFASGEERMRLRSGRIIVFDADEATNLVAAREAAKKFMSLFPDKVGPRGLMKPNGQVDKLNVEAVKSYMNSHPQTNAAVVGLFGANARDPMPRARIILRRIFQAEKLRVHAPKEYLKSFLAKGHRPAAVVVALTRMVGPEVSEEELVRIVVFYVSEYAKTRGKKVGNNVLRKVRSAVRNIMDKLAHKQPVAQTSAGDKSPTQPLHERLIKAGDQ
ncbi:unnamed protein product [Hyaloperonospora brassicae]|uniref:Uncharacterized protein n=1 Tax=Hyaloperonospora brassicae TaxID=162125 RepID=A0AAV0UZK8_HYABA|nr:unnamed protein product [Hyaloperonospora brassicae]